MIYLSSIPNFSSYGVTFDGEIFSIKNKKFKKVAIVIDADGYARAMMNDDSGKRRYSGVHRVMYSAFKGNLRTGLTIDHIDGNRTNNHWSNLEQVSFIENIKRSFIRRKGKMLTKEEVEKVFKLRSEGYTQMSIAEIIGINQGSISLLLRGKSYKGIP